MSCSKDSTIDYMVKKALVKPNMDLYTTLPTKRLIDTIDRLTDIAKSKYDVDKGALFKIKSRDISVGNYQILGNNSIVTKIRLEPNDEAFLAIDESKQQEELRVDRILKDYQKSIESEVTAIEAEGNYIVESGEVIVPHDLPQINIKC